MAKALLLIANPNQTSLNHILAQNIATFLVKNSDDVDILDLYKEGLESALAAGNRAANLSKNRPYLEELGQLRRQLTSAQLLIIVFPVWWFGVPHIVKGWVDRVFSDTTAFDPSNRDTDIAPRLHNLKSVIIIPTFRYSWWVNWFLMNNMMRFAINPVTFRLWTQRKKCKVFNLYRADKIDATQLNKFTHKITSYISKSAQRR